MIRVSLTYVGVGIDVVVVHETANDVSDGILSGCCCKFPRGATMLVCARVHVDVVVNPGKQLYCDFVFGLLLQRCQFVLSAHCIARGLQLLERIGPFFFVRSFVFCRSVQSMVVLLSKGELVDDFQEEPLRWRKKGSEHAAAVSSTHM